MSVEHLFKAAVLHAARVGFDEPQVRIPLYGRAANGERVAVLDGRLADRYGRLGFLVLRTAAEENDPTIVVTIDRSPVDTVIRSHETQSTLIPLRDHGGRVAAGILSLHTGDDYPSGSTINGRPVVSQEFRPQQIDIGPETEPAAELPSAVAIAA